MCVIEIEQVSFGPRELLEEYPSYHSLLCHSQQRAKRELWMDHADNWLILERANFYVWENFKKKNNISPLMKFPQFSFFSWYFLPEHVCCCVFSNKFMSVFQSFFEFPNPSGLWYCIITKWFLPPDAQRSCHFSS